MILVRILVGLVALFHFYFMVLEIFLWTKPKGLRIFRNSLEFATASKVLAANQGLYNGFLCAGLIWGLLNPNLNFGSQIQIFFLSCVFVAGLFGAATVSKRIFFIQSLPALLAFGAVILNRG